jgi:hypothetical protein
VQALAKHCPDLKSVSLMDVGVQALPKHFKSL